MRTIKSILVGLAIAATPSIADADCCHTMWDGDREIHLCSTNQDGTIWYFGVDQYGTWQGTYDNGAETRSIESLCAELLSY